jgi:hypothetical protein
MAKIGNIQNGFKIQQWTLQSPAREFGVFVVLYWYYCPLHWTHVEFVEPAVQEHNE